MMKFNETGRSMVEMLGVLAIIGVLSVGGIAGYNQAMNRYRANEILNTTSMMVMLAKAANGGQGQNGYTLNSAGLNSPYGSVGISVDANPATSVASVTITSTGDTDVCSAINSSVNSSLYTVSSCGA